MYWDFNNICIKSSNEWNIVFYMNCRLFKLLVSMNSNLATFQTIMKNIFWNLIVKDIIIVYLKNILIFTQILKEYYKEVLEFLAKHKLFLCSKKYKFDKPYIEYLDLVISKDQVEMDFVCNWFIPTYYTDSQIFLGFINFYWRFIYSFWNIACSLFNITESNSI